MCWIALYLLGMKRTNERGLLYWDIEKGLAYNYIKPVMTYRDYKYSYPYYKYYKAPQLGSRLGGTIAHAKLLWLVIRGKPTYRLYRLYGPLPLAKARSLGID
jgi:hypothetical protein